MIKKKIVIELQFGSEKQEELHMPQLKALLSMSSKVLNGKLFECDKKIHHKDNKMDVFYFDKE